MPAHQWRFTLTRVPNMVFFCQAVRLPSVTLEYSRTPNPFHSLNVAGTGMDYGELSVEFVVDEDAANYIEIFDWLEGLGFPERFKEFADLERAGVTGVAGEFSDAALVVANSTKNGNVVWRFEDIFPISLDGPGQFDTRLTDVVPVTATATFACRKFNVSRSSTL